MPETSFGIKKTHARKVDKGCIPPRLPIPLLGGCCTDGGRRPGSSTFREDTVAGQRRPLTGFAFNPCGYPRRLYSVFAANPNLSPPLRQALGSPRDTRP